MGLDNDLKRYQEIIKQYEKHVGQLNEYIESHHYITKHSKLLILSVENYIKEPCEENYNYMVEAFKTYKKGQNK